MAFLSSQCLEWHDVECKLSELILFALSCFTWSRISSIFVTYCHFSYLSASFYPSPFPSIRSSSFSLPSLSLSRLGLPVASLFSCLRQANQSKMAVKVGITWTVGRDGPTLDRLLTDWWCLPAIMTHMMYPDWPGPCPTDVINIHRLLS